MVNDCSLDNSKEEIERFIKQNINIQFIENKVNLGKGGSIRAAIQLASGDYCIIHI